MTIGIVYSCLSAGGRKNATIAMFFSLLATMAQPPKGVAQTAEELARPEKERAAAAVEYRDQYVSIGLFNPSKIFGMAKANFVIRNSGTAEIQYFSLECKYQDPDTGGMVAMHSLGFWQRIHPHQLRQFNTPLGKIGLSPAVRCDIGDVLLDKAASAPNQ